MAFETLIREMKCPKCNERFEEGSRRFCPTDGARLISDEMDEQHSAERGGIFSNLLPKINSDKGRDEVLPKAPAFLTNEDELDLFAETPPQVKPADPFFEIADLQPEPETITSFTMPEPPPEREPAPLAQPEPPKPVGRKVNPYDIPAGHVELGDSERTAGIFNEFDADKPDAFVGRMVKGRYRVTEFLGGDGAGLAFLADDKIVADKMVLVRILLEDDSDEIMGSILAEERVSLSHFTHPNIARLIDSGEFTNGTQFLISEYTDALSVRDILSIHEKFDPMRAARVIRQASHALNEAHQEGIIHRDIRPENLVIVPENVGEQVKLVNFGASSGEPNSYNAAYKAPEVLEGRIPTVSSDIFSLAVVAYEMLTGNLPFDAPSGKDIVRMQYAGLTMTPSMVRPELTAMVDDVFSKALSFNGTNRFAKSREFGDAFYNALAEPTQPIAVSESSNVLDDEAADIVTTPGIVAAKAATPQAKIEVIKPINVRRESIVPGVGPNEPAWKYRSPEPPAEETSRKKLFFAIAILGLLAILGSGWYYVVKHPSEPEMSSQSERNAAENNGTNSPTITTNIDVPPLPRHITQPPNTDYYQNTKQNLKGDLLRHFVGFSLYYPKDWKVNGPQASTDLNARGKFLDISRLTPDGKLREQMLISYYPSKGTFKDDSDKFAAMVKESNETLKKLLPGYQMVSEGEIHVNGDWRAYEIKFQGSGTSDKGEKLMVWGRRLFIPAARPGVRDGFEITMIATSLADGINTVDDVGVRGELGAILASFEPSQNF